ncbi:MULTISPECIES: hypothetical protein [unclassified Streptomyces]|uniref:hypothetical protein n=1 Tax=unclassified Streptomyces TaxID=2593676 RepID=UPI00341FAB8D
MSTLPSGVQRVALVVLLSRDSRTVLLDRRTGETAWCPLRLDVSETSSYMGTVRRWLRRQSALPEVRLGYVTGHLAMTEDTAAGTMDKDYCVMILKLAGSADAELLSPSARWWPIEQLGRAVFPQELGVLIEGYVGGWIPDGPITLDG